MTKWHRHVKAILPGYFMVACGNICLKRFFAFISAHKTDKDNLNFDVTLFALVNRFIWVSDYKI